MAGPVARGSLSYWPQNVTTASCRIKKPLAPPSKRDLAPFPRADSFNSRQFIALTLDEFATAPRTVLPRIATFLGVGPFPRLVLNWNWQWNQLGQGGSQHRPAPPVQDELRAFYVPHNFALAALLRKRGQGHSARYVDGWARSNGTAQPSR